MSQSGPMTNSGDARHDGARPDDGAGHGAAPGDGPVDPAARRRSRLLLLAIVASFAVPLLLAILWLRLVQSGAAGDLGDTSRGELIRPAVPLEAFALADADGERIDPETLRGIWTMLYVPAGECAAVCQRNLYHMRQVRLALNNRMKRVQRIVLVADGTPLDAALVAEHPGLLVADGDAAARAGLIDQIRAAEAGMAPLEDAIYLVDPLGNLMMRFDPELAPGSMLKDVKHLLKVSKIG